MARGFWGTLRRTLSEKQTKEGLGVYTISKKREPCRIPFGVPKLKGKKRTVNCTLTTEP